MKKKIKKITTKFFATLFFQPFFEKLHYISLKGMNYGSANSVEDSGELAVVKLLKKELSTNPIIFDVGANYGQYLEILLKNLEKSNPIIHSFEPDNKAFRKLQGKFGNTPNVFLNNFALGEKESISKLYFNNSGGVDSSLINTESNNLLSTEINVKTLDDYCLQNKINEIDFLKIDVEGFELSVLKGSKSMIDHGLIKRIQLEHGSIHSIIAGSSLYLFSKILSKFSIYHIKQNGIRKIKYSPKNEIFYNSNYYFKLNKNKQF